MQVSLPKIPKDWKNDLQSLPKVDVTWNDATTIINWKDWDSLQAYELVEIHTIGHLLPSGKNFIRVAPSIGSSGEMSDVWLIPRAWIKSVKRIK